MEYSNINEEDLNHKFCDLIIFKLNKLFIENNIPIPFYQHLLNYVYDDDLIKNIKKDDFYFELYEYIIDSIENMQKLIDKEITNSVNKSQTNIAGIDLINFSNVNCSNINEKDIINNCIFKISDFGNYSCEMINDIINVINFKNKKNIPREKLVITKNNEIIHHTLKNVVEYYYNLVLHYMTILSFKSKIDFEINFPTSIDLDFVIEYYDKLFFKLIYIFIQENFIEDCNDQIINLIYNILNIIINLDFNIISFPKSSQETQKIIMFILTKFLKLFNNSNIIRIQKNYINTILLPLILDRDVILQDKYIEKMLISKLIESKYFILLTFDKEKEEFSFYNIIYEKIININYNTSNDYYIYIEN